MQIKTDKNKVAASVGAFKSELLWLEWSNHALKSKITCLQIKTDKNEVAASFGITVKPLKVKVIKSCFKVKDHVFAN